MATLTPCRRRRTDGSVCTNLTDYADGWCRQEGCTGFRTATAETPSPTDAQAEEAARPATPSTGPSRLPWRPVADLDLPLDSDEAYDVTVTRGAREDFIGAHGGTHAAAEAEIRTLLEDALHQGKARRLPNGRWQLTVAGYKTTITADGAAVVRYGTLHRERSYAQIRAKVPSRISTGKAKLPPGYHRDDRPTTPPEPGPHLPPEALRNIDPTTLTLTDRTVRELARQSLIGHDDTSTRTLIAPLLRADLATAEIVTLARSHIVEGPTIRWKLSADGNVLFSAAKRHTEAGSGPPSGAATDRTER